MADKLDKLIISITKRKTSALLKTKDLIPPAVFEIDDKRNNTVSEIIKNVKTKGDRQLIQYTKKFDSVKLSPDKLKISAREIRSAYNRTDPKVLGSIKKAVKRVMQYQKRVFVTKNKVCGPKTAVRYTPIERVGICVPAASAPLPSTVIMTAVPAIVAGVKQIAVVSAPRYNRSVHPVILAACFELGITEVYRIGGAQAVASLAFGTESIPRVFKITGPGNQWVQTAKQKVSGFVGIDSLAGPSEVLIIADRSARPQWVAADMLSQAEHAPGSAFVLTDSKKLATDILSELKKQIKTLSRPKETAECLTKYCKIAVLGNLDHCIELANDFAAEHLQIQCGSKSKAVAKRIRNAGAIFIGSYSPVAAGDYLAGPSHTLPTGQTAKFYSALSSNDFVKATSIIEFDKATLTKNATDIIRLADTEGLDAHAKSIQIRLNKKSKSR